MQINSKQKNLPDTNKYDDKSNSKVFIKHVWWLDALIFIGGTILLGGLASLLGGKMFNFQNHKI